jgi:hypothetical protein
VALHQPCRRVVAGVAATGDPVPAETVKCEREPHDSEGQPVAFSLQAGLPALFLQRRAGLGAVADVPVQVAGDLRARLVGVQVIEVSGG